MTRTTTTAAIVLALALGACGTSETDCIWDCYDAAMACIDAAYDEGEDCLDGFGPMFQRCDGDPDCCLAVSDIRGDGCLDRQQDCNDGCSQ